MARLTGVRDEPQGQHLKTLRGRFHWAGIGPAHCLCQSAPCAEHREKRRLFGHRAERVKHFAKGFLNELVPRNVGKTTR